MLIREDEAPLREKHEGASIFLRAYLLISQVPVQFLDCDVEMYMPLPTVLPAIELERMKPENITVSPGFDAFASIRQQPLLVGVTEPVKSIFVPSGSVMVPVIFVLQGRSCLISMVNFLVSGFP